MILFSLNGRRPFAKEWKADTLVLYWILPQGSRKQNWALCSQRVALFSQIIQCPGSQGRALASWSIVSFCIFLACFLSPLSQPHPPKTSHGSSGIACLTVRMCCCTTHSRGSFAGSLYREPLCRCQTQPHLPVIASNHRYHLQWHWLSFAIGPKDKRTDEQHTMPFKLFLSE